MQPMLPVQPPVQHVQPMQSMPPVQPPVQHEPSSRVPLHNETQTASRTSVGLDSAAAESPILAGSIDLLQAPISQQHPPLDTQSTGAVFAGSDADLMAAILFGNASDGHNLLQEPSELSVSDSLAGNPTGNPTGNINGNLNGNTEDNPAGNLMGTYGKMPPDNRRVKETLPAPLGPLYSPGSPASRASTSSLEPSVGFSIGGVSPGGATNA